MATEFMLALNKTLTDRKLSQSTANAYLKTMTMLNDKKPFKNLSFLKKSADVLEKIKGYAESTQRSILGAICSVLWSFKDKAGFKKPYEEYHAEMKKRRIAGSEKAAETAGEKTEKEKESWLTWDDVQKRLEELKTAVSEIPWTSTSKAPPSAKQWDTLLQYVILALYTLIPPRRNQDYMKMHVVRNWDKDMPTDRNYYDFNSGKMIFNVYKTAKKHGQYVEEVPKELEAALTTYLVRHPQHPKKTGKMFEYPLLVDSEGKPFSAVNSITRVLNKIFGKRVGSSMLRHVYLSYKYNIDEIKKDSEAMGHDMTTQRTYLRSTSEEEPEKAEAPPNVLELAKEHVASKKGLKIEGGDRPVEKPKKGKRRPLDIAILKYKLNQEEKACD